MKLDLDEKTYQFLRRVFIEGLDENQFCTEDTRLVCRFLDRLEAIYEPTEQQQIQPLPTKKADWTSKT